MKENCYQSEDLEDKLWESEWNESWNEFKGKLKERRTHQKQFIKDLDHLFLDQTNNYDVTNFCRKGVLLPQGDTFSKISCV